MSPPPYRPGAGSIAERFGTFVAIDWSGAAGPRQRGIAVAVATAGLSDAPALVRPGHVWSREGVLDWLTHDLPDGSLVGLDLGIALPFVDCGAYFPGWAASPPGARALWALVDAVCADEPALGAAAFVDHDEVARHLRRHGGRQGDRFPPGRGRLRVAEGAQRALGLSPVSNLNLVGPAQVGKSSFTGMRMLHRLPPSLPVWPIDPLPAAGSVIVEIYTALAARAAGRRPGRTKIRDAAALDAALATLGCTASGLSGAVTDHAADALVTAAWLRRVADDPALWHPRGMTPIIARTEGWTFGVP